MGNRNKIINGSLVVTTPTLLHLHPTMQLVVLPGIYTIDGDSNAVVTSVSNRNVEHAVDVCDEQINKLLLE